MALTPIAYLGAAGTGKTYQLLSATRTFVEHSGLRPGQKVLALTFMHGSRRRMVERLSVLKSEGIPTQVETLDSFALRLIRRFRRHCGLGSGEIFATNEAYTAGGWVERSGAWYGSYDQIRSEASVLLSIPPVAATLRASNPLILIDEAQDCRGTLFLLVQALSAAAQLVCAADPFQDLAQHDGNCPVVDWLKKVGSVVDLTTQHRTGVQRLLDTANALRHGDDCRTGIPIVGTNGAGLAAYEIQRRVPRWQGQLALISPVAPDRNSWVGQVLHSLHKVKASGKIWPAPFTLESTSRASESALITAVLAPLSPDSAISVDTLKAASGLSDTSTDARRVYASVLKRMRLSGAAFTSASELEEAARRAASVGRARGIADQGSFRRAMTVHGAKNREFDYVFVLWPYALPSSEVAQQKLLYNAITRARKDAVVLVQGEGRPYSDPVLSRVAPPQRARAARR